MPSLNLFFSFSKKKKKKLKGIIKLLDQKTKTYFSSILLQMEIKVNIHMASYESQNFKIALVNLISTEFDLLQNEFKNNNNSLDH